MGPITPGFTQSTVLKNPKTSWTRYNQKTILSLPCEASELAVTGSLAVTRHYPSWCVSFQLDFIVPLKTSDRDDFQGAPYLLVLAYLAARDSRLLFSALTATHITVH